MADVEELERQIAELQQRLDQGAARFSKLIEIVTQDQRDDVVKQRVPAGVGIAGWVVEHAEPVVVKDARDDPRFYTGLDERTGFETRSIVAVPLRTKEHVVGVVEIINKLDGDFEESDV